MEKVHLLHHCKIAKFNPLHNKRGMTVTELLVVVGLIGVVALGNAKFIADFTTALKKQTARSEGEADLATLNIATVNILKKSASSFNKLSVTDDTGKNFYDYYPDVPYSTLKNANLAERKFTLTVGEYFYLLQTEEDQFDSLVYDPMFAYKNAGNSPDMMNNGSIQYVGLNSVANVTGTAGGPNSGTMTKVFSNRWADGKLFLLSCPTYLRPLNSAGGINILTAPRFASYLGRVAGSDLIPMSAALASVNFQNTHPVTNASYNNADIFLRTLPPVGGAAPFVKVEPVNLSRITIRLNPKTSKNELVFQTYQQGQYVDKNMLLQDLKSVTFIRKSVTLPLISMEVIR
ncbi:hypothetical protein ACLSU7_03740 [Bdellovibrio sp. HCB185ZH]|uniref:hypothetical protein n=1 Tax=Bdellovibrio sp. HCB185ZH TaxID=3394235 RepID=UPI0039A4B135